MKKNILAVAVTCALALTTFAGCSGSQQSGSAQDSSASTQEQSSGSDSADTEKASSPISADKLNDGTYDIDVTSSSKMFKVVKAELTVADGSMSCVLTLSGTGYGKLFMGTGEQAAAATEADYIPFVEDAEGKYTYTFPVEALDADTDCAAWSIKKEQWYDRVLVFESSSLPSGALK
ncbi:hypothetical protein [Paratractidigestivibacter sp.]|uniref:hypothetical protein n=1 Tax=Paratractidigestivibacter sp. TaxID=2847316 RepID=UPI002ABDEFCB|nr:hypothetical protein [Paratractidigestivibacter sp.]